MSHWMCIVKMCDSYGLLAVKDGDWAIRAFDSESAGLSYFERSYWRMHERGREASMSATINWLSFQPSICQLELTQVQVLIKEFRVLGTRNVSGSVDYVPLSDAAAAVWEAGAKPSLVNHAL